MGDKKDDVLIDTNYRSVLVHYGLVEDSRDTELSGEVKPGILEVSWVSLRQDELRRF